MYETDRTSRSAKERIDIDYHSDVPFCGWGQMMRARICRFGNGQPVRRGIGAGRALFPGGPFRGSGKLRSVFGHGSTSMLAQAKEGAHRDVV